MQPQQPNHPAPPDPTNAPPGTPTNAHTPGSYPTPLPSPEFAAPVAQPAPAPNQEYNFILNNPPPKPKRTLNNSTKSLTVRIILGVAALFVLLIAYTAVKNALSSSGIDKAAMLVVLEDQSEITHLTTKAAKQPGASSETLNSATTAVDSVSSAESQLLGYLAKSHVKVKPTVLTLKVSRSTDNDLVQAALAGLYDQTYQSTMETWLATYQHDLKQAYTGTSGPKGRVLLKADSQGAALLLQQLTSPVS